MDSEGWWIFGINDIAGKGGGGEGVNGSDGVVIAGSAWQCVWSQSASEGYKCGICVFLCLQSLSSIAATLLILLN